MSLLKSIVMDRENMTRFSHATAGVLYYRVKDNEGNLYEFPVDMNDRDDVGTTRFDDSIKAVTMMRYIRKAISADSLIKLQ